MYTPKECKIETIHPAHDWLPSGDVPGPGPGYRRCSGIRNPPYEEVDHPAHYGGDVPYEPIKVMEAWEEMFHLTVNVMMAVKYLVRAGTKPGVPRKKDLRKALWHIQREIDRCND